MTSDEPLMATRPKLLHLSFVWSSLTASSSVSKTVGKSVVHDRLLFFSLPTITTATDAFMMDICRRKCFAFAEGVAEYRANWLTVAFLRSAK